MDLLIVFVIWLILGFLIENIFMSFYLKRYPEGGSLWPLTLSVARLVCIVIATKFAIGFIDIKIVGVLAAGEALSNFLKITRLSRMGAVISYYCTLRAIGSLVAIVAFALFAFKIV